MGDAAFCAQRAALTGGPSTSEELDALRARLIEDGYLTTAPSAELAAAVSLKAVREGMRRLVAAGWPATLILMYDEAWVIAHHYGARVSAACGGANVMSFDMLAWLIVPSEGHAGFAPHRDRQPPDVRSSFHGDGSPKYCTAWVALGDADPDTSCLYLIPRGVDPGYDAGDDAAEGAEVNPNPKPNPKPNPNANPNPSPNPNPNLNPNHNANPNPSPNPNPQPKPQP